MVYINIPNLRGWTVIHLNDKFKLKINISKIKHILKYLGFTKKI